MSQPQSPRRTPPPAGLDAETVAYRNQPGSERTSSAPDARHRGHGSHRGGDDRGRSSRSDAQPAYQPPQPQQPPRSNGWAIAALVLGIITVALSPIPILNQGGILVGFVGVGLSIPALIIGVRHGTRRTMAIVAAVLAVIGLVLSFVFTAQYVSAIDKAFAPVTSAPGAPLPDSTDSAGPVTYQYEITSPKLKSASGITWTNATGGTDQVPDGKLPWRKTVTVPPGHAATLIASTPTEGNGGTLTCTVRSNGQVVATQTASGQYANVIC